LMAERIAATQYLVEADDFAQSALWERYASETYRRDWAAVSWEQLNPGTLRTIGHVGDLPVCVCLSWARIGSLLVCFYEATSVMVDWNMVKAWLRDTFPNVPKTDATNFSHCAAKARTISAPIPGPEGKAGSLTYPGLTATAGTTGADARIIGPGGASEVDDG
jgi:hypothetical protein